MATTARQLGLSFHQELFLCARRAGVVDYPASVSVHSVHEQAF
jgi:hypothetical protein